MASIELSADEPELLFFDTFSHDINEELNLDLVQFPEPVYVTEVRIIPLGARVQADFPGGVRLGATNPSEFHVDFFVNDLGKPGASTFENLGSFEYNQNDCINLDCSQKADENVRQIPTDGLVLRGWYTTITLAVYGTFTKVITDIIASPPATTPQPPQTIVPVQIASGGAEIVVPVVEEDWDIIPAVPIIPIVSAQQAPVIYHPPEEYFASSSDVPKDPRISDWSQREPAGSGNDSAVDHDWDRAEPTRRSRRKSHSSERPVSREISRTREKSLVYSRSQSREREYSMRAKQDTWTSRSPEYMRSHRKVRESSYELSRVPYDKHRISPEVDDHRKRPRTPPVVEPSPRRPRTPGSDEEIRYRSKLEKASKHHEKIQQIRVIDHSTMDASSLDHKSASPISLTEQTVESPMMPQDDDAISTTEEQFEPILSDEEIGDDADTQFDMDYDFTEYDDVTKMFNPFEEEVKRFRFEDGGTTHHTQHLHKEFDAATKILHKFNTRCDKFNYSDFSSLSPDGKECWVHFAEQFIQLMSQFNNYSFIREENDILIAKLVSDPEMATILCDWMKIGLDFEMSLSQPQPGYKIRHIKAGVRLVEMLLCYDSIAALVINKNQLDIFSQLFLMYEQKYMALSIKLMIIKAMHSAVDSKISIEHFLDADENDYHMTGYQILLKKLEDNPLTRIKFALKSLVKKLNMFESLKLVQEIVANKFVVNNPLKEDSESDMELLKSCLMEIYAAITYDELSYGQPKRFLPVSSKFEFIKDAWATKSIFIGLLSHFKTNAFLETLLLLVTYQNSMSHNLIGTVYDILSGLMRKSFGIEYLADNIETTNLLVKILFGTEKVDDGASAETGRAVEIGCEIAFKIHTKYHLDAIINYKNDADQLIEILHSFYSLTCNTLGKSYVLELISTDGNIVPILNLIEHERKSEASRIGSPGVKIKSPVLNYSVDIIDATVRNSPHLEYLEEYGMNILDLVKNHEMFESSVSAMFQELAIYLKPLEIPNVFTFSDISALCDLVKRSIEFITTFPGDLIMGLRIIRHMGILDLITDQAEYSELRYKYIIYDFYSHDGVATIVSILDKVTTYFEQPAIHSATLASAQGVLVVQTLLPAVEILHKMLAAVIKCRNTAYKDITAIEPLLKTYNLMYHVPYNSNAYRDAKKIQSEIIKTLLAYTQPLPPEGVDTDSVHKSLWTQMIGEVIKYIQTGPYTFMPGLLAFCELLPLPLPIITAVPLSQSEVAKLITERQLWSAHLHPQSTAISEMIQTICFSSYPQLMLVISRVCIHLADLAPNMTLLVSKTIVDLILNEHGSLMLSGASTHTARLLTFISNLMIHPTCKVSMLSILPGKFLDLLVNILTAQSTSLAHIQAEQSVNTLLQSLLDAEITMIAPNCGITREMNLACALPPKECVVSIANAVLENFVSDDLKSHHQLIWTIETINFLTVYDFTLYQLRTALETYNEKITKTLHKYFNAASLQNQESIQLIDAILDFLYSLITIESEMEATKTHIPLRTIVLNTQHMRRILGWKVDDNHEEPLHPLEKLKKLFSSIEISEPMLPSKGENAMDIDIIETTSGKVLTSAESTDVAIASISSTSAEEKAVYDIIQKNLTVVLDYLKTDAQIEENSNTSSSDIIVSEPILPQPDGIVAQYATRQFYLTLHDHQSLAADERLSLSFWLTLPSSRSDVCDEQPIKTEQVACDLNELIRTCLPNETNITSECKRLLHLSASPQAARERTTTAPCYRTRRVEVEPSTGRPEKKIFITPMRGRGFARTPPSRGDLFRSRPPNTSRPPSLHVDDFLALETCGAQPTGPTGYNKLSRDIISIRGGRSRGRGFNSDRGRISSSGGGGMSSGVGYRQRPWQGGHMSNFNDSAPPPPQHYRTATSEPVVSSHFQSESHYPQSHFGGSSRGRISRGFRGRFNR